MSIRRFGPILGSRARAGGFSDPGDLSPEWWLRADLGVTTSGGAVTEWVNQGSEANGTMEAAAARGPTFNSSDTNFNSQDSVSFISANNDVMGSAGTGWWELAASDDDITWIFVIRPTATGSDGHVIRTDNRGSAGHGGWDATIHAANAETDPSSQFLWMRAWDADGDSISNPNSAVMRVDTVYVLCFTITGSVTTDTLDVYVNNWKATSATANVDAIDDGAYSDTLRLGGTSSSVGDLDADIAECIMLKRALTAQEDADLAAYFNTRYGLNVSGIQTGSWAPYHLGASMWMRGDLGVDATTDSDPVTAWTNQGLDINADCAQGTAAYQPTWTESETNANSQSVVSFDGTEVIYAAADNWWHLSSESSDAVWVAVAATRTASGAIEQIFRTKGYQARGGMQGDIRDGNPIRAVWRDNGGTNQLLDNGSNGSQNTLAVAAGVLTGQVTTTADDGECWVNGASSASSTSDLSSAVAASSNSEWIFGGNTETSGGTLDGWIAEFIYLKRLLSATEDGLLETYLEGRYNLTLPGVTQ